MSTHTRTVVQILTLTAIVATLASASVHIPIPVRSGARPELVGGTVQGADFAMLLPGEVLQQKFAQELPLVEQMIKNMTLPTTCCYDNVGARLVHLDFQGIHWGSIKPEGGLKITTAGLEVQLGAEVQVILNYRLCLHDDPFGHGCSTLFGCKGDGKQVTINGLGSLTVDIGADASGKPAVRPGPVKLSLTEASDDICGKINDQIRGELGKAAGSIEKLIGPIVAKEIAKILAEIPGTVPVGKDIAVEWTLDNSTETLNDAVQVVGDMKVLAAKDGNKPGPFPPIGGLPLVAPDADAHLLLHECVFSNFAWAMFDEGLLTKNTTVAMFDVELALAKVPTVSIAAGAPGPVLQLDGTMTWSSNGTFDFALDVSMAIDTQLILNDKGDYVEGQLKDVDVEDVELIVTSNHTVIDPAWMKELVQLLINTELPKANAILATHHLPLPSFKSFKFASPALGFLNNTLAVSGKITPEFSPATAMWQQTPVSKAIACPNIGDKDNCI